MASKTPSKKKSSTAKSESKITLNKLIQAEIKKISKTQDLDEKILEKFAHFVIGKYKEKDPKPLTLAALKKAIFNYFTVENLTALKKSGSFQMATSGMEKPDLSKREGWEILYRKFIGILPNEENEQGYGCINGIDIFKYDLPWRTFGLDPKVATTEEVKSAYRELSKIYHPDVPNTGNAQIFDRLTIFYKSLTEKF